MSDQENANVKSEDNFVSESKGSLKEAVEVKPSEPIVDETNSENNEAGEGLKNEEDESFSESSNDATAKTKKGFQKSIDRLTRQREEAKRELEAERQKRFEIEKQIKKQEQEANKPKAPKESDFEYYSDFIEAEEKFNEESKKAPIQEPEVEVENDSKLPKLTDSQKTAKAILAEKLIDANETYKDFAEVAYADDVPITPEMVEALAECDNPAEVLYHLAKNKEKAGSISDMSPIRQAIEIAKLEESLKTPSKPLKVTKASEPITPVNGRDATKKAHEDMSFSEYEKDMNKRAGFR